MPAHETPFGHIIIYLLKGILSRDEHEMRWSDLLQHQTKIQDYLRHIGLQVIVNEAQGYAYVRQRVTEDEQKEDEEVPRLVPRRPLRYAVSLMLVLLRKRMVAHDASTGETRLIVTQAEIHTLCETFLKGSRGEAKFLDQIDRVIEQVIDLGFLRKLPEQGGSQDRRYEVRRILKAFVDAQWLHDFSERLETYRQQAFEN